MSTTNSIGTIAYLNSEYPSLSHTFIEREIRGLRALGFEIRPFSAKPATTSGRAGAANAAAAAETIVLQTGAASVIRKALAAVIGSPVGFVRAMIAAQRLAPPGLASRVRHAAYVLQGMILASHLRRLGIDHVHVHMANNGAAIAMLACVFDPSLRYSLSIHGSAEFFHVDSWTLAPKVEKALFVRCISSFCKAQVMAWTNPSSWERFGIVHCGIDPEVYSPRPERTSGPLRLLTVGRLHPIKGYTVLLDSCRLLLERKVDFQLTMLGDGPLMPLLKAKVAEAGLGGCVRLVGPVPQEEIQQHFDAADAMVISSFMEGVPVVLMEAMAKQMGVITTRVGGIAELVEEGRSGLFVDAGSAESLARAVEVYASAPTLCREHGEAGRRRVIEAFGTQATASGMADLFRRFAASQPGGSTHA